MKSELASVDFYSYPKNYAKVLDQFWLACQRSLRVTWPNLSRFAYNEVDFNRLYTDPELVFTQACGYHWVGPYKEYLDYLATPVYNWPHCEGPFHRSLLITTKKDVLSFDDAFEPKIKWAINSEESFSGFVLLKHMLQEKGRNLDLAQALKTGSHYATLQALRAGQADCALVDCVSYGIVLEEHPEWRESFSVIYKSPLVPTPPFVCSTKLSEKEKSEIFSALSKALKKAPVTLGILSLVDAQESYELTKKIVQEAGARI